MQTTDKNTRKALFELLAIVLLFVIGYLINAYLSEVIGKALIAVGTLYLTYLWLRSIINPFGEK
ncbi:MAG: hypothetical protein GKR92_02470 [Gammaproteobacteria bacterium]|nr:MAG: hypothetical protein GKR92_02470 [Gammaproteobacteria bacterium]